MSLGQLAAGSAQKLTEPRALQACERIGILPSELRPKPRDDFAAPGLDPVIIDMRAEHHETRRQGVEHGMRISRGWLAGWGPRA
jgi:protein-tyrosine-phosphatase